MPKKEERGLWDLYWSQHALLLSWHAATLRRRQAREEKGELSSLNELDPDFIEVEFPCENGELSVVAADRKSEETRPDIELLFCAIARLGPIAYCSFAPETVADGKVQAVFRAQLSSTMAALTIGRELAPFIAFCSGPSQQAVVTSQLILRGGPLLTLVTAIGCDGFQALFDPFGPCMVELPRDVRDDTPNSPSPFVVIRFTDSDSTMAVLDASAAIRSLQLWLAFDWGLLLTYDRSTTLSGVAAPCNTKSEVPVVALPQRRELGVGV